MPISSPLRLLLALFLLAPLSSLAHAAPGTHNPPQTGVATDQTNYNVGSPVMVRSTSPDEAIASIRYAGEATPLVQGVHLKGTAYQSLWTVPSEAKTGRYEIDLTTPAGSTQKNVASFAVHRQLAKVIAFDLDKTFYTAGDAVDPRIVVQNISDRPLTHLQVEFENYTYPWIAQAADDPPAWKTIAAPSLSLAPGEIKELRPPHAAVVQTNQGRQTYIYFSAVIRDSEHPDHIYDLAFAPPAITAPVVATASKTYPALYLYPNVAAVPASEAYREFYPPAYVSSVITFNRQHTMYRSHAPLTFTFSIQPPSEASSQAATLDLRILDRSGKVIHHETPNGPAAGNHALTLPAMPPGLYTLEVVLSSTDPAHAATARLDFAVNDLPNSILIFCAHQDDDTAYPEIIRAAVENNIPVHVVYFTSGDAGGCDRYYMHSCDASRAMDFGEVRMDESRAALGHLGIPPENIFFLGLPDGGMEQIWHAANNTQPYLSVLLASDHSPYRAAAIPNLPYARAAVVSAAENFITRFKPALIITGHPDERHVDHRTNNWVVVKAMQALLKQGQLSPNTQLIVDQVYGPGPQKHAPYRYATLQFYVSGEAAKLGQEASWYYQTQDGNHQQAEIVTYNKLPRDASPPHWGDYHWPYPHYQILDWQQHEGWNEP